MGGQKTHTKNIIELNGRRYDALSGRLIDGFTKVSAATKKNTDQILNTVSKTPETLSLTKHKAKRHINHSSPHKPEHAKTLMRNAVQKPAKSQIKLSKSQIRSSDSLIASTAELLDTRASKKALANARRENLSKQVMKSPKVRRFTDTVTTYAAPKAAAIGIGLPKHPVPVKGTYEPKALDNKAKMQKMLADGLARSKSHEQPQPKPKSRLKKGDLGALIKLAVALVVLVMVGVGIYIFRASIEIQIADMRSGVQAELPGSVPAGYEFAGPLRYTAGEVTINYKNGQNALSVTEENSSWDSQTLRDSVVLPSDNSYQTYQNKGKTVYLYGNGKATWVNDGIWYLVESSPSISGAQLQKIADSM